MHTKIVSTFGYLFLIAAAAGDAFVYARSGFHLIGVAHLSVFALGAVALLLTTQKRHIESSSHA